MRHHRLSLVPDAHNYENWMPTRDNINALPKALRGYIHDLELNVDAVETMRDNFRLRREVATLKRELASQTSPTRSCVPRSFFLPNRPVTPVTELKRPISGARRCRRFRIFDFNPGFRWARAIGRIQSF